MVHANLNVLDTYIICRDVLVHSFITVSELHPVEQGSETLLNTVPELWIYISTYQKVLSYTIG